MCRYLALILVLLSSFNVTAARLTCSGKVNSVGFLPQYNGKIIGLNMDYRNGIWAKTLSEEKTDITMSLLLAALMADKSVNIQFNAEAASCSEIPRYTGAVIIERIYVSK